MEARKASKLMSQPNARRYGERKSKLNRPAPHRRKALMAAMAMNRPALANAAVQRAARSTGGM